MSQDDYLLVVGTRGNERAGPLSRLLLLCMEASLSRMKDANGSCLVTTYQVPQQDQASEKRDLNGRSYNRSSSMSPSPYASIRRRPQ